jgi:hypothetical protein
VLALNGNMLDAVSLAVRAALVKTMYECQLSTLPREK